MEKILLFYRVPSIARGREVRASGPERRRCVGTAPDRRTLYRPPGTQNRHPEGRTGLARPPTEWPNNPGGWAVLLKSGRRRVPKGILVHSLGKVTSIRMLKSMSNAMVTIVRRLNDPEEIHAARIPTP